MMSDTVPHHLVKNWRSNHLAIILRRIGDTILITITILTITITMMLTITMMNDLDDPHVDHHHNHHQADQHHDDPHADNHHDDHQPSGVLQVPDAPAAPNKLPRDQEILLKVLKTLENS